MPSREALAVRRPSDVQAWVRRRAEADAANRVLLKLRNASSDEERAAVGRTFLRAQRSARRPARTRTRASKD